MFLLSALILIIYGTVNFGEKYIWLSGSINYLCPTCMMIYLLRYFYRGICERQIPNKYITVFYWILAFATKFSQENTVFVTDSFILILVFSKWKELVELSKKEISH